MSVVANPVRDPDNRLLATRRMGKAYIAALASLVLVIIGTLSYPDTFVSVGLHVGSIRVSPMGLEFIIAAPALFWFAIRHRSLIHWGSLDTLLVITLIYVTVRGMTAATNGNELGLVFAFTAYILMLYYGAAFVGQDGLRVLYLVLIAMGIIAAVYAIIEFALGENVLYGGIIKESMLPFAGKGYHRSSSIIGQPGALGTFMVQVAPLLIFFFIWAANRVGKVLWGLSIFLIALAMLLTYSKGPWIVAAIISIFGLLWLVRRRTTVAKNLIVLFLVVATGLGVFTLMCYDTVQAGTFSKARTSESTKPREYMWSRVPSTFLANPLIGAGLWQASAEIFRVNPAPEYNNRPKSIDNIYLTALVEQGVAGVILIVLTLWLMGAQAWKAQNKNHYASHWGWPLAVSMIAVMINGFTINDLMIWPNMVVFWLMAGMLRALVERVRREGIKEPQPA